MRIRVYPYKQGSKSAAALADALGGRVLKHEGSTFQWKPGDRIINWGASQGPRQIGLNTPEAVATATNKLLAFRRLREAGVSIPDFAERREDVHWDGLTVVRHKLSGHSGEGIELVKNKEDLPLAPLYVRYIPKQEEYRVHVVGKSIILVQRKARRNDTPDDQVNWQVRNHQNGFVFARNFGEAPNQATTQAVAAIEALGLDFGAVDVIWNAKHNRAYVLECNTAPGLEGSTAGDYARAFRTEFLRDAS